MNKPTFSIIATCSALLLFGATVGALYSQNPTLFQLMPIAIIQLVVCVTSPVYGETQ